MFSQVSGQIGQSVCVCVCTRAPACACMHACSVMSDSCVLSVCVCTCACMHVHSVMSEHRTPPPPDPRLLHLNTEVGCHFLVQGIFLTQGLNPCLLRLLHCRQIFFFHRWATREAKCKSKLQWNIISHQLEWPSLKILQITNAGNGLEKRVPSYNVGGNVSWCSHYGKQ